MIIIMIVAADSIRLKWIWRRLTIADKVVKSIKDDKETKKMYAYNKVNKLWNLIIKIGQEAFWWCGFGAQSYLYTSWIFL